MSWRQLNLFLFTKVLETEIAFLWLPEFKAAAIAYFNKDRFSFELFYKPNPYDTLQS